MRTICTHVAQSAFAATMSAMRLWLDQNGNPDIRFETATEGTGILISVEFSERMMSPTPSSTDLECATSYPYDRRLSWGHGARVISLPVGACGIPGAIAKFACQGGTINNGQDYPARDGSSGVHHVLAR